MNWPTTLVVRAKCPRCSRVQRVMTLGNHRCIDCGANFLVAPINKPSRVVFVSDMPLFIKSRKSKAAAVI